MMYISGRVTNNPNFMQDFSDGELDVVAMGCKPINPVANVPLGKSWIWYMRRDLRLLLDCDSIYMLKGWWRSRGARLEWIIAKSLNYKIIYK